MCDICMSYTSKRRPMPSIFLRGLLVTMGVCPDVRNMAVSSVPPNGFCPSTIIALVASSVRQNPLTVTYRPSRSGAVESSAPQSDEEYQS